MSFTNNFSIGIGDIHRVGALVNEYKATMTAEDFRAIYESGGMDGVKYRAMMFKAIAAGLTTHMGVTYTGGAAELKRFLVAMSAVMLGMFYGTTPAKRVLVKNMGGHMTARTTNNDVMAINWLVMDTEFCTYVNDTVIGKAPSIKYPSCMADFCLVGVCIMASEVQTTQEWRDGFLNQDGSLKAYNHWPALFQKQWIGNFNLSDAFQNEHKDWEENFWTNVVTKTRNTANKEFEAKFTEEFYFNTAADNIQFLDHELNRVSPGGRTYTKEEFANFVMGLIALFRHTQIDNTLARASTNIAAAGPSRANNTTSVANYLASAAFQGIARGVVGVINLHTNA